MRRYFEIFGYVVIVSFSGIFGICVAFFILVALIQGPRVLLNPTVGIIRQGQVIYTGNNACIDVVSGGDTTKIDINGGFLCMFPKETILGKDIEIVTLK